MQMVKLNVYYNYIIYYLLVIIFYNNVSHHLLIEIYNKTTIVT